MLAATTYGEMTLRLLATLLLCGLIGLQRAFAGKTAGVRTHGLVGLGACAMTLVSAYAFPGRAGVPLDPTRLAAQIVLGIGFLGGGTILKEGVGVRGLTTAASLWVVAGVGIACGSGLIPLALIATALTLLTLACLGRLAHGLPSQQRTAWMLSCTLADPAGLDTIVELLRQDCPSVRLVGFADLAEDRGARVTVALTAPPHLDLEDTSRRLLLLGARDLAWRAGGSR